MARVTLQLCTMLIMHSVREICSLKCDSIWLCCAFDCNRILLLLLSSCYCCLCCCLFYRLEDTSTIITEMHSLPILNSIQNEHGIWIHWISVIILMCLPTIHSSIIKTEKCLNNKNKSLSIRKFMTLTSIFWCEKIKFHSNISKVFHVW